MLSTLVNIFAAPGVAFDELFERPQFLLFLLLIVGTVALTNFLYFQSVDPEFMVEDMLAQTSDDLTDAEREEAREALEAMAGGTMKWMTMASGSIGMLLVLLAQAVYLLLVSMFTGIGIRFKRWFSFICAASLPTLLALLAGIVTLLLAGNGDVSMSQLNPLTLSNLMGFKLANSSLQQLLSSIDLTRLWSIGLMLFGYQRWTGKSWLITTTTVLAPFLVIYAIWLYAAL